MRRLRDFLKRFAGRPALARQRQVAERDEADQPLVAIEHRQPTDLSIAHALEHLLDGVIVVAGAGNSGGAGMVYPAAYPEVIAVGATGSVGQWPIDDPTTIWGPAVVAKTACASSSQREIVPSSNRPSDSPWPE